MRSVEIRNAEALGRMLQQGRLLKGMSQRDLADQLGIGQKWIWEMESGKPGLFTERLFQMLRATGCHLHIEIDGQSPTLQSHTVADLRVELYGHLIGHLTGTDWRSFTFRTDRGAFDHFELGSTVLSESVPLDLIPNRGQAAKRRNFFTELLPEGRILTNLANRIGVREFDVIPLLSSYGRDVAGALQIFDPERPGEPREPRVSPLTQKQLGSLLLDTVATPLGNSPISGKSSLAGVQDKIVVARLDGKWHQVHDGYPSTHIIKPLSHAFATLIYDEEYGCRLARSLDLAQHSTEVVQFGDVPALVIERYDRSSEVPQGRLHQEDMNQALGAHGDQKYQELGGKVSLKRIAALFSKNGDHDSLSRLLALNTLSVAIGNLDLHAKNISILHRPDGEATLAPAYDLVPMRHFNNDGRMALAINGSYVHSQVSKSDIVEEAKGWGMRRPEVVIDHTLESIAAIVKAEIPLPGAHPHLAADVTLFTTNLLSGKPAGNPKTIG